MADFVAVIKRAVDGLPEKSPAMRERVYEKARTAVRRQLENMDPRPSEQSLAAQLDKLETAILTVEADCAEPVLTEDDLVFEELAEETAGHEEKVEPAPRFDAMPEGVEPPAEPAAPVGARPDDPESPVASEPEGQSADTAAPADAGSVDAAVEDTKSAGPAPVPFGTYAIGRAPSFPIPPDRDGPSAPPASSGGFMPSRYQTGFGTPADPGAPVHEEPGLPEAPDEVRRAEGLPDPEPVAATQIDRQDAAQYGAVLPEQEGGEKREAISGSKDDVSTTSSTGGTDGSFEREEHPQAESGDPAATAAGEGRNKEPSPEAFFEQELAPHEDRIAREAEGTVPPSSDAALATDDHDHTFGFNGQSDRLAQSTPPLGIRRPDATAPKGKGRKRAVGALIALLVLAGAGYAAWTNQDQLVALFSADETVAPNDAAEQDMPQDPQIAAVEPDEADEAPDQASDAALDAADNQTRKFTQRLLPNGQEIDEGPAPGVEESQQGDEGRTLTRQTSAGNEAPDSDPADSGSEAAPADAAESEEMSEQEIAASDAADPDNVRQAQNETAESAEVQDAIGVGQTMFLYEERLGQRAPTALEGSVVWSMVEESPGGDAPPEEAIEGRIEVPEKDLSAIITFRRNTDTSLPASHLIEIVFSLPANFEGGGIETVQRIAFKGTEQARGNELIAVPARITDDFFMVALNDYAEAVSTNLDLMRDRSWIDIPIIYGNGRRALITLDKGTAGSEIFNRAISAWQRRNGGSSGNGASNG